MEHAKEGNDEGHSAREPARGITHACYLCLNAIAIHACFETRELTIRALSAFAIERAAFFGLAARQNQILNSSFANCFKGLFLCIHAELKL